MNDKLSHVILPILMALFVCLPGATAQDGQASHASLSLHVHLPREVTVHGGLLTLGQISVVRGDPALVSSVGKIGLGRLSVPGQKAVLDRSMILSRLASYGIATEKVRLTGAETVAVRRYQTTITTEDFLEMGKAFIQQHLSGRMICDAIPTVRPKDVILPGQVADLQVTPGFVRKKTFGGATVRIVITADGEDVAVRDMPFRFKYRCRRAVTLKEIAEGEVLTAENVKIETVVSDRPEPAGWKPPYGLVAVRVLRADTELRPDMASAGQSAVVVRRNDTVVIRIARPGLIVSAVGTALQEARVGEFVKVRNADSNRIIVCKVNNDGTVEPMI